MYLVEMTNQKRNCGHYNWKDFQLSIDPPKLCNCQNDRCHVILDQIWNKYISNITSVPMFICLELACTFNMRVIYNNCMFYGRYPFFNFLQYVSLLGFFVHNLCIVNAHCVQILQSRVEKEMKLDKLNRNRVAKSAWWMTSIFVTEDYFDSSFFVNISSAGGTFSMIKPF